MRKYLLIISLVVSSFYTQASNLINDERVKNQSSCFTWIFTDYSSWRRHMEEKYKVKMKSDEMLKMAMTQFDSLFGKENFDYYQSNLSCVNFEYLVDGKTVNGYVIKPKISKGKLPVLIYNRGGNGNYGAVVFGSMMRNLFPIANEGFIIIGSQYRGTNSKDTTLQDQFGGDDVNDVIALLEYISKIEGADEQRIGMFGASRGGMQTHLVVKQSRKIKAIATIAGVTDLLKELDFRPEMEKVYKASIPDYEKNKVSELEKRSVLSWVDTLSPKVPILLLHGENDNRVAVSNSIAFANELSKYNITHKLVVYPGDNHGLMKNKSEAIVEIAQWFKKYL